MSALEVLRDPAVELSVALAALQKLLGPLVLNWESDTIRIELERRGIAPSDSLMAKLLAAQTVKTTANWSYDHDVFFSFALACEGHGGDYESVPHPTPEQLCWAVNELQALLGITIDDDNGFDPDTIDPAVAAVLQYEGYVVAPVGLEFADDVLDRTCQDRVCELRDEVKKYAELQDVKTSVLAERAASLKETACGVQLQKLVGCRLYVAEREMLRTRQYVALNQ